MNIWIKTSSSRSSNLTNSSIRSVNLNLPIINEQRRRYEEAEDTQTQQDFEQSQSTPHIPQQKLTFDHRNNRNPFNNPRNANPGEKRINEQSRSTSSFSRNKTSSMSNKDNFADNIKKSVRFNFQDSKSRQIQHSKRPYQIEDDLQIDTASVIQSHQFIDGLSKMKFKHIKKQNQEQTTYHKESSKNQNQESIDGSLFTFQNNSNSLNKPSKSNTNSSKERQIKNDWSKNTITFSKQPAISSKRPIQRELKLSGRNQIPNISTSRRSISYHNQESFEQQDWNQLRSKRETSVRKTTGRTHIRQHIISIIEYCSNQVGLAIYNTNNGQIYLCQIIQRLTYFRTISTIQRFYPLQIIYSSSLEHTPLIKKLNFKFRNISFKNVKRLIFDQTKGFNIYNKRGNKQDYNPDNKFIAYSALNALIFYLQNSYETKFNYNSLNIKWHIIQDLLIIQSQTILELQVFLNAETKNKQNCFIDNFHCLTYGGTRMLRANILQPLSNIKAIQERQDLVGLLLSDKVLYKILCEEIGKLKNFQIITAKFIQSPKQQNMKSLKSYILSIYTLSHLCLLLKNFHIKVLQYQVKGIPLLSKLISLLNDPKISQLKQTIQSNFDEQILKSFDSNRPTKKQNFIFLFKIERLDDQFIQIMRITYSHTLQDIFKIFKAIKEKSGFELKLLFNEFRGYYIKSNKKINLSMLSEKIADDIIQISEKKQSLTFSTTILVSLNNRLKQTQKKLILLSENLLKNIIFHIQKNIDVLFQINYDISILDMILSFVSFIKKYQAITFTKPIFQSNLKKIEIQGLKTIWTNEAKFNLSTNINLSINSQKKIAIIQKQTNSFQQLNILYSIGYLAILSQIGCYVPAVKFCTQNYQTILSKITHSQSIESNLSHFQTELYHLKNILDNSTHHSNHSLILLNQFVKGTQYQQQLSLSLALINQFLNIKGMTFALVSDQFQINIILKISTIPSLLYHTEQEQQPTDEVIKLIKKLPKNMPLTIHQQQRSPIHFQCTKIEKNLVQTMNQLNFADQFIRSFKCLTSEDENHSSVF